MVPIPLPVIYDGRREPELDIISIPGLPTLHPHYKLKGHNKWLAEVLSHQVRQARIMALQYDFGKDISSTSWPYLLGQAETLLYNLASKREEAPNRPIIFICYSFGSIILKKALCLAKMNNSFRSLFDNTRGIVFMACVHDESYPDFENVSLKCAAVEFGPKKRHQAVETLRKSPAEEWSAVKDVVEKFRLLRCRFAVRTLYELNKTAYSTERFYFKSQRPEILCSEPVSSLGWDNEIQIGIERDHSQLTMYPSRGDTEGFFERFLRIITDLVEEVCPPMPRPVEGVSPEGLSTWAIVSNERTDSMLSSPTSVGIPDSLSTGSLTSAVYEAAPITTPCYVMTPFEVNPDFEGRTTVLNDIHEVLRPSLVDSKESKTYVIAGIGGVGKTQVALSYAFRYQSEYEVVLCADTDGKAKLSDSFIHFAKEMGLGDGLPAIKAKQSVKDALRVLEKPWLIVFDNADGDDKGQLLREFCPEAGRYGSVLITTRDVTLLSQSLYSGTELGELTEEEAISLLLKLTSHHRSRGRACSGYSEREDARSIARKLGYLPLGIVQAASLVIHESCSLSEFMDAYNHRDIVKDFEDMKLQPSSGSYTYTLSTVWNMNFDKLKEDERDLINLMSYLDPDRIQMSLLKEGASTGNADFSFIATPRKLLRCRAELLRSSLISQSKTGEEVRMHRLMQASCQLRMSADEQRLHFSRAVQLLIAAWPIPERFSIHNPALWAKQRALLPHVQSICEAYQWSCDEGEPFIDDNTVNWDFAKLLYEAGWFCYESGLLECVFSILNPAKEYCLRHLSKGGGYRYLADIYGGLGSAWTESNRFQDAFDDFSAQWKYIQLAFEHGELSRPSIWEVFGLGRLGNGLQGLHRYQEAEGYYRRCLEAWKGLPGDQKIFTTHLSTCLWLQGRLDEAESSVRSIIKDWDDKTNFRTAMAIYCLGNILIAQGTELMQAGKKGEADAKFAESMKAHAQVLKLWNITLGSKHHKTADAMHKLAWHYHRNKFYDIAINYLEDALLVYTGQPQIFKNEIARTKYKLGCALQDKGDLEKGSELVREAESLRKEIVSPEDWEPAAGEEDFDDIVQFWTR